MSAEKKTHLNLVNCENIIQHGAITLEFIGHNDKNEVEPLVKKKVQDILTEMYVRAKKRGRPRTEEKESDNAAA